MSDEIFFVFFQLPIYSTEEVKYLEYKAPERRELGEYIICASEKESIDVWRKRGGGACPRSPDLRADMFQLADSDGQTNRQTDRQMDDKQTQTDRLDDKKQTSSWTDQLTDRQTD